ncbi:hypothetical protein L596_008471 [Steinernema carpocapsae]|uniref:SXP/RAL-2 family protein Ani s 5-like cation-binding domain-containing protein n=1 Tax=Steinernema carpocapsae TaxID=34508 RepID=A0A4V6A6B7_STECR|nr:hypothetical protein L596_008471 [Steinernema carpocapsae]
MSFISLVFATFLIGAATSSRLSNQVYQKLEAFVDNGGQLASSEAANVIIATLQSFDISDTGFARDDFVPLNPFFVHYINGIVKIYRKGLPLPQQIQAVRTFTNQMTRELEKWVAPVTSQMKITLGSVGIAIGKIITTKGIPPQVVFADNHI